MSVAWTITGGSYTDATFASLHLSGLRRSLVNQGNDRCTFVQDGASFDGTALFAVGSTVTIKRATVKWFVGRVVAVNRAGSARGESIVYELAGPWWYLENLVFQQNWKIPDTPSDPASTLSNELRSTLILNLKEDGSVLTTRQQIKEAVDYAIAVGASIAITDTDFPALTVTWEEGRDMTCAEVIRRQLRWAPDACLWWDYTAATPTLHCARRASATAVSYAVDGSDPEVEVVELRDRPDLQVPVVALKYESINQQDDCSWTSTSTDKYPVASSESQFGALIMTIQLSGSVIAYQRQKVKTRTISESSDTWWKKHLPWLNDTTITSITISGGAKKDSAGSTLGSSYVNELVDGAVPSWLESYATLARIEALLSYTITNAKGAVAVVKNKPVTATIVATTSRIQSSSESTAKEYKQIVTWIAGESAPTGLAQALYDALSVLQYEGRLALVEDDCASSVRPGHVLNLTAGLAAWATMKAQIQQVAEDVDEGRTEITVGPAQHLGPQDLLELLRPNRTRRAATSSASRTTGAANAESLSNGPTSSPDHSGGGAAGPFNKLLIKDTDTSSTAEVKIDLADCSGKALSVREIDVCDGGVAKKMRVLASAPYN